MYNYIGPGKATPGIFCTAILSPYLRNGKPVIRESAMDSEIQQIDSWDGEFVIWGKC